MISRRSLIKAALGGAAALATGQFLADKVEAAAPTIPGAPVAENIILGSSLWAIGESHYSGLPRHTHPIELGPFPQFAGNTVEIDYSVRQFLPPPALKTRIMDEVRVTTQETPEEFERAIRQWHEDRRIISMPNSATWTRRNID